ncbi:MAG: zinc ribbon domain-containing protein, partial [Oscillospiraceae bacterium]|nr:zinc ribbon domain-containing protein [Oscillospiraceae bacterium]
MSQKCSSCGAEIEPGMTQCSYCGQPVETTSSGNIQYGQ